MIINLYPILTILIVLKDHWPWAVFSEAQRLNLGPKPTDGSLLAWGRSWARDYRERNLASSNGRTWTRRLRNTWTTLWLFDHTASICPLVCYIRLTLHCIIAPWWLPCDYPWSIYSIDNFLRTFKCWMLKESGTGLQCSCRGPVTTKWGNQELVQYSCVFLGEKTCTFRWGIF